MLADLLPHQERIAGHREALLPSVHWTGPPYAVGFLGEAEREASAAALDGEFPAFQNASAQVPSQRRYPAMPDAAFSDDER